jgi:hypothetical protein
VTPGAAGCGVCVGSAVRRRPLLSCASSGIGVFGGGEGEG